MEILELKSDENEKLKRIGLKIKAKEVNHGIEKKSVINTKNLNLWYGDVHALKNINVNIPKNSITALIGPSGCGKTTLLRCFNRMNDVIDSVRVEGEVLYEGNNIYGKMIQTTCLRKKIGMVFQKPNPFPMSVFENIAYGPKIHGIKKKEELNNVVQKALKRAAIWDEVSDRLDQSGLGLSGGQQQRICIARAIAVDPEIILMDEPTSALDPIATTKIENLLNDLISFGYTVIIVTHNMQQAARVSHYTGFMYMGELIEFDKTSKIFENPSKKLTENYITGRFG